MGGYFGKFSKNYSLELYNIIRRCSFSCLRLMNLLLLLLLLLLLGRHLKVTRLKLVCRTHLCKLLWTPRHCLMLHLASLGWLLELGLGQKVRLRRQHTIEARLAVSHLKHLLLGERLLRDHSRRGGKLRADLSLRRANLLALATSVHHLLHLLAIGILVRPLTNRLW